MDGVCLAFVIVYARATCTKARKRQIRTGGAKGRHARDDRRCNRTYR